MIRNFCFQNRVRLERVMGPTSVWEKKTSGRQPEYEAFAMAIDGRFVTGTPSLNVVLIIRDWPSLCYGFLKSGEVFNSTRLDGWEWKVYI